MNRKKGFTLAELLIVVAIIGVLVAVSVPVFTAQHKQCDCIYVYVSLNDAKPIQTAPYLDQNGNIKGDNSRQFG